MSRDSALLLPLGMSLKRKQENETGVSPLSLPQVPDQHPPGSQVPDKINKLMR
jgi:hypothetical protein